METILLSDALGAHHKLELRKTTQTIFSRRKLCKFHIEYVATNLKASSTPQADSPCLQAHVQPVSACLSPKVKTTKLLPPPATTPKRAEHIPISTR